MKCDIHAYNMLYNSVRFCIFKRPAVHCYCCFSLGYTKKHTYFHISFSNENGLGNLIANPWLFWPPEDALIFLLLHFGVPSNYIPTKGPVKQSIKYHQSEYLISRGSGCHSKGCEFKSQQRQNDFYNRGKNEDMVILAPSSIQ